MGPWNGLDLEEASQVVPDPFGDKNDVLDPTFWAEGSGGSLAAEGFVQLPPAINVPPVEPREANEDPEGDQPDGEGEGSDAPRPATHDDALEPIDCTAGPPPNPAFANAWGTTVGLAAREGIVNLIDVSLDDAEIVSEQHAPGQDHADNGRPTNVIGDPTGVFDVIASFRVVDADSHSFVRADPLLSNQTTRVEMVNLSLLDGLVTADVVRGVASTNATPSSAGYSSAGSVIEGLTVHGDTIPVEQTSHPWTTIDLSNDFGNGSRVSIYETMGHVHMPETPIDGFAGDMIVNMIHVWLRDKDATDDKTDDPLEIIVSHASSHSDFPQVPNCAPLKGVLGEAYNVHVSGAATGVPVTNGFVKIPMSGGQDEQAANDAHIADTRLSTLQSRASGGFEDGGTVPGGGSRAVSEAHSVVQDVCILETEGECLINATLVEAKAFAEAFPNLTTTSSSEVTIADLKIGELDVCDTLGLEGECRPPPDTTIPVEPFGNLVLNEQLDLESDGPCHAIVGVRAIHFVPNPDVNLPHVIISEAQAGAFFC